MIYNKKFNVKFKIKMEHISNYELYGNIGYTKAKPFPYLEKITVLLFIIIILSILYLICLLFFITNKTYQLNTLNYKKYILDSDIVKLNQKYYESFEKNYSFDEEFKEYTKKIKLKEDYINNYIELTKELFYSNYSDGNVFIKLQEQNKQKEKKVDELKTFLDNSKENIMTKFNSKIFDEEIELNNLWNLITNNYQNKSIETMKLCYRGENKKINLNDAYENCLLNNANSFLMIFQNNLYNRYGVYISNNDKKESFTFLINSDGFIKKRKIEELDSSRKQSLLYLINLIIKNYYDNSEYSLDLNSSLNIIELFLF